MSENRYNIKNLILKEDKEEGGKKEEKRRWNYLSLKFETYVEQKIIFTYDNST